MTFCTLAAGDDHGLRSSELRALMPAEPLNVRIDEQAARRPGSAEALAFGDRQCLSEVVNVLEEASS